MSLAVEFVAAAADVGAAFVVVVLVVVAAVAACIKTFVAVVLEPSSLFPSLLSLSQNLSLPFLSDTQWFLIHLPFFLGLLHHLPLLQGLFKVLQQKQIALGFPLHLSN